MRSKEDLFRKSKSRFKPVYLLAFSRFLTYKEMQRHDILEPFYTLKNINAVKSKTDWDKNVMLAYNKDNVCRAFCIALHKAISNFDHAEFKTLNSVYVDDIKTWLYILEDSDFTLSETMKSEDIINVYKQISLKYKFNYEHE